VAELANRALQGHGFERRPEVRELLLGTNLVIEEGEPPVNGMAVALFNHADVLTRILGGEAKGGGKAAEARELLSESKRVELGRGEEAKTSPLLARVYLMLAGMSQAAGEHSLAIEECERSLAIETALRGAVHHNVATVWNVLGSAQLNAGDFEEGLYSFQKACDVYKQVLVRWEGADSLKHSLPKPEVEAGYTMALNNLGATYMACKEHALAVQMLNRCVKEKERMYGPGHVSLVGTLSTLSQAHEALGDDSKAKEAQERVAAINMAMVAR